LPVFIEFAASSALVAWFSSCRKQAETELHHARSELQLRVEERTAELKQTNERLLAEIVERKRAEDAYYEAQAELARVTRISALGALAASISHEVNQPLAAVVTNADACMMWLSSEPPNLEEARLAVDCIAQQGTRARNQVEIQTELADDLPTAMGDRVPLQQVIVNLIQNGIEAMSAIADRPRLLVIRSERPAPDQVLVVVQDSGIGIDRKNERRIFDAFFTTKAQGTGMGLAISHSIIEAHGGRLWASGNSAYGATFQFTLPTGGETTS